MAITVHPEVEVEVELAVGPGPGALAAAAVRVAALSEEAPRYVILVGGAVNPKGVFIYSCMRSSC